MMGPTSIAPKKISILIPIHNRLKETKRTLHNLFESLRQVEHSDQIFNVIMIDDGSKDGSGDWINLHYPSIHVLKGSGDLWWSGAMNRGADFALHQLQADFIICWNHDILCSLDYFKNLLEILKSNDHLFIGSIIYDLDVKNKIISSGWNFNPMTGKTIGSYSRDVDNAGLTKIGKADWTGGMGTIIHRKIFEKIGYWDARAFPQYKGDTDFCLRTKRAGFQLFIYSELKIWADFKGSGMPPGQSWLKLLNSLFSRKSNFQIRTEYLFLKRHGKSILSYRGILSTYFRYIGGFIKRKYMI